jgi:hypothetical protein
MFLDRLLRGAHRIGRTVVGTSQLRNDVFGLTPYGGQPGNAAEARLVSARNGAPAAATSDPRSHLKQDCRSLAG